MTKLSIRTIIMGCVLLATAPASANETPCKLVQVGEIPVKMMDGNEVTDARINDHPVTMIVDTGSSNTVVFRSASESLGLKLTQMRGVQFYGVGGEGGAFTARINDFGIGTASIKNLDVLVTGRQNMGPQGVLGADLLLQADVEFDFPSGKVRFFRPEHCSGDQVVYWGKAYSVVPMQGSSTDQINVLVSLGGTPVRALMDTGAAGSVVTTNVAAKAGVGPSSKDVVGGGSTVGLGAERVQTAIAAFSSFSFGDETIRNAKLRIGDIFGADKAVVLGSRIAAPVMENEMLLGADFFRAHRVYVSKNQRKVYVSYVGGPVFDTHAARPGPSTPVAP